MNLAAILSMPGVLKDITWGQVRSVMLYVGGYVTGAGIISSAAWEFWVMGVGLPLAMAVWSAGQKIAARK